MLGPELGARLMGGVGDVAVDVGAEDDDRQRGVGLADAAGEVEAALKRVVEERLGIDGVAQVEVTGFMGA